MRGDRPPLHAAVVPAIHTGRLLRLGWTLYSHQARIMADAVHRQDQEIQHAQVGCRHLTGGYLLLASVLMLVR